MAQIDTIRILYEAGNSQREISRLTGIHRETIGRYIQELKQATPAKPDPTTRSGPVNACEPFREFIEERWNTGLSGQRIYQDLQVEHRFQASYSSVRRFLQQLQRKTPLPFRRCETAAGEEAQIDFGTGAWVQDGDRRRRPWLFRLVLSYSRKAYSEAVWRQTTDSFVLCLENAFQALGGVPQRLVIDNLKAAVSKADWYDPEIHPKLQSFAAHYQTAFLPTRPYTPRHKGKVEGGVKYAQNNALQGRSFTSLEQQNDYLWNWEATVADQRIHGTTKEQVGKRFEKERPSLTPLPRDRFANFQECRRNVHQDGHIELDKAYYSAPPEYLGRRVWVRSDARLVRLFNDRWEPIGVHVRASRPGQFGTLTAHIRPEKVSGVERGANALLRQISLIGPHTRDWASAMTQSRGIESVRVLLGLKQLAKKHRSAELEQACETALRHGAYRLRTIRQLLTRQANRTQQQFDFIEHHPVIRPLQDYSLASLHQFRKERNRDRLPS